MLLTEADKGHIKAELAQSLKLEPEVRKIVIFGSFLTSDRPHDLDVAVFQDSRLSYLPLALKYRRLTRSIARRIPMDILPMRTTEPGGQLANEILNGEVVYERQP